MDSTSSQEYRLHVEDSEQLAANATNAEVRQALLPFDADEDPEDDGTKPAGSTPGRLSFPHVIAIVLMLELTALPLIVWVAVAHHSLGHH